MEKNDKIYIAGHTGLVGSALTRNLRAQGYANLIYCDISELDLTRQDAVEKFFESEKPDHVFLAAAKVGGIHANNSQPAEFIYINLQIQNNIIHNAFRTGVKKLCFLGSSCIYPRLSPQPLKEEYLLDGKLEPTNEPYAIAKIAGIKMCQSYNRQYGTHFISVMPTNLFGINDNFDLQTSHVLPALIRKFIEAKKSGAPTVTIWGTGTPRREFLFVDDMADACIYLMNHYEGNEFINIGKGKDATVLDAANVIKEEVGFNGSLIFDTSKPDGTPQKLLDVSRLNSLGWKAKISFREGIRRTIEWYEKR